MHTTSRMARRAIFFLAALFPLLIIAGSDFWDASGYVTDSEYSLTALRPPAGAMQTTEEQELAFPADSAGFSAYYRLMDEGSFSLDKGTVDGYIFSPISAGDTGVRTSPATLVSIGDNYTVARVSLENIDDIVSTVNLYYDDEGWIIAFLPKGTASSQIWQARKEDVENPRVTDIALTTLLDTLNVVISEALEKTAIEADEPDLGYYHWQFPTADNFLMMAVSRQNEGEYPVQFSIPESLDVSEISATLWISQDVNVDAPCARIEFDEADLIAKQCEKGIFSSIVDLSDFESEGAHSWKLVQSERNEGASGGLLMIVYSESSS